ncbi:MAG: RNA 2',3'-cyclic phosphodiesterase [Tistlia sp.]
MRGLGTFDEGRRLRSLWVGVEPSEPLQRLQAKVETAAQRAGLPAERRKFKPHVTLARFKDNPPEQKLQHYLAAHGLFRCGPFPVEDFVLYSSFLAHTGALYQAEAVYPLQRMPAYG